MQHIKNQLYTYLQALSRAQGVALAYSGGIDSRVLLKACLEANVNILAVHATGPQFAAFYTEQANSWVQVLAKNFNNLSYSVIKLPFSAQPEIRFNQRERCYYCKKGLLTAIGQAAPERVLLEGSNASDTSEYRPGNKARRELKVISPFEELNITKAQIYELAAILNVPVPQKYQNCLLTRFQYGLEVTPALLTAIQRAENNLYNLFTALYQQQSPLLNATIPEGANAAEHTLTPLYLPEYRLRYCTPNLAAPATSNKPRFELHLKGKFVQPKLSALIKQALTESGLDNVSIKAMPVTAGFFDTAQKANL